MKIQRHLAPTAAPVSVTDLGRAILGLFQAQRYRVRLETEIKQYFGVEHVFLLSSGTDGTIKEEGVVVFER